MTQSFKPLFLVAVLTISILVLNSCSSVKTAGRMPALPGVAENALPIYQSAHPAPYRTVSINGADMLEGCYPEGKRGGVFVRSIPGRDPKTFNPWVASDLASILLGHLMFSTVTNIDSHTGEIIPGMAETIEALPDGVTYITKLRKGLKWSDGKPITSEDIAFTWNNIIKAAYGNASLRDIRSVNGKFPQVTVVDELTNKYVTPVPFAPFKKLIGVCIAPKHILEPVIKQKDGRKHFQEFWSTNVDPTTMVTSGPFRLSRYEPAERVEFTANPNFYMVDHEKKPLPYLAKLTYLLVPHMNTEALKFRANEIDEIRIKPEDTPTFIQAQSAENFKLYNLGQDSSATFMTFNMNKRKDPKTGKSYVDPVKSIWFNDVNFRQAINHAISRQKMVDNIFKGVGFPIYTFIPPACSFINKSLKSFPQDLKLAQSLLAKSGFTKDVNGNLQDKNGNKVEFTLLVSSGSTFAEAGSNMVTEDLKQLGIKVNQQVLDANVLTNKLHNSFDWETCFLTISSSDPFEPNNSGNVFRSNGRLHVFDRRLPDNNGEITVTDARPFEKQLDKLFDLGATTMDEAKRKKIYDEYQKIIYDEAPLIYLASPMAVIAVRNTVENYDPTPLTISLQGVHNIEEIYKDASAIAHASGSLSKNADYRAVLEKHFPYPGPFKTTTLAGSDTEFLAARGEPGKFGGNLRLATFGADPKTLNPWSATDLESDKYSFFMFERLVDIDAWTGEPIPKLAKSIETSADGKTYTITLRKGLKWSDGKPITADDVVFTFNKIIKAGLGNAARRDVILVKGKFPDVKKIDDLTVRFTTAEPFTPFLTSISAIVIAPKHVVEPITKKGRDSFYQFWDLNAKPESFVVSGPFKLNRRIAGQRLEFVRNKNFAMVDRKNRRLPYLDGITVAIVPDLNTEVLKFYGEELDILDIRSVRGSDAALMKQREKTGNFSLYNLGPDDGKVYLVFNMNRRINPKTKKPYVDPVKQRWFNNKLFRQGISHAIDRDRIIANVMKGVGTALYSVETPASYYFDAKLPPYKGDLNYAHKLLGEAGFKLKDGVLYDDRGNPVEFTLNTNGGNSARDAICIMIKDTLKQLGIKVNYDSLEFSLLINKIHQSLDYEAIVMGLSGSKLEPHDSANVWMSAGRTHVFDQRLPDKNGDVKVTDARPFEKEIDAIFDQAGGTFDEKKKRALYDRYQEIVYEEQPFIYLYCPLDIVAVRNTIGNYKPLPTYTYMETLHNLEELFIK